MCLQSAQSALEKGNLPAGRAATCLIRGSVAPQMALLMEEGGALGCSLEGS